jgi:hypothetical protein
MKTKNRSFYLQIAALALALSFGLTARAESPREEVAHAYVLLKMAKSDYHGHKAEALHQLELVGHDLGMDLHGRGNEHERQLKSDELLAQAGSMVHEARNKLEARDRERAAEHLDKAIHEIDEALRVK